MAEGVVLKCRDHCIVVILMILSNLLLLAPLYTVKPVLRDQCCERSLVLKDYIFLAEGSTFQYKGTCHQRPPVLRDHISMSEGVIFQDRLYCIKMCTCL